MLRILLVLVDGVNKWGWVPAVISYTIADVCLPNAYVP